MALEAACSMDWFEDETSALSEGIFSMLNLQMLASPNLPKMRTAGSLVGKSRVASSFETSYVGYLLFEECCCRSREALSSDVNLVD